MVETQKEKEDRMRREAAAAGSTWTGTDPNLGAIKTVPEEKMTKMETKPGESPTSKTDWEKIQHPGTMPKSGDPYGTRPVSDLTPPQTVSDKADLAAVRMMEREKADRERMERERVMTTATTDAAAARAAMTPKEMTPAEAEAERERMKAGTVTGAGMATGAAAMTSKETTRVESEADRNRMKTGAAVTGAALATGAAVKRTEPAAGERTIRQGAAVDTPPTHITPERPMTGVVPPTTTTTTTRITPVPTTTTPPVRTPAAMSERERMHAEDPSVHPDWETQPQINAPRDVGIPTAEGQADAARIRAGQRRSDVAEEPRLDRRGGDIDVPLASGARSSGTTRDDRSATEKIKDTAVGAKEKTKETARDVKEDVDRKI